MSSDCNPKDKTDHQHKKNGRLLNNHQQKRKRSTRFFRRKHTIPGMIAKGSTTMWSGQKVSKLLTKKSRNQTLVPNKSRLDQGIKVIGDLRELQERVTLQAARIQYRDERSRMKRRFTILSTPGVPGSLTVVLYLAAMLITAIPPIKIGIHGNKARRRSERERGRAIGD